MIEVLSIAFVFRKLTVLEQVDLKSKMFMHLCLILYSIIYVFGTEIDAKLELVQVTFRHGDRTPTEDEVPLLPQYNESYEPWGVAQLTREGMIREYEIGKMLRAQYNDFLPNMYRRQDIYAYSSNTERCIVSLQLVLAALYTPVGEQIWNDNLNWIPIPIHTNPKPLDILIRSRDCPMYTENIKDVLNSEDIKSSKLDTVFRSIQKHFTAPLNYENLFGLTNIVKIRRQLKMPLPEWCTDETLKDMIEACNIYLNALSYTHTLKRLSGGPLVRRFLENIINSNSKINKRKIYLYSAHDKILDAFMRSHNITGFGNPDFGSAIIVEKYRNDKDQYFIKILYWTGEPKALHTLKLENCSEMCPMEMYSEIIEPSLPSDDEMLCLLKNKGPKDLENILNADYVK